MSLNTLQTYGTRNFNVPTDSGPIEVFAVPSVGNLAVSPLQGIIFIDPQNSTGLATPTGQNQTSIPGAGPAPVFDKWSSVVAVWGGISPYLTRTTQIIFLSSHTDTSDPVIFRPFIGRGALVVLQGQVATLSLTNLSATTAKNRSAGANSLLTTTLSAAAVQGQRVQNLSHPSNAWAYKSLGASAFQMAQPFVASAVGGTTTPAEVDTWANNDAVALQSLTAVNLAYLAPVAVDGFGAFTLFQVNGFGPGGTGADVFTLDTSACLVTVQECSFQRIASILNVGGLQSNVTNALFLGGLIVNGPIVIVGGATAPTAVTCGLANNGNNDVTIDGDFIFGGVQPILSGLLSTGFVFMDVNLGMINGVLECTNIFYGGHVLYGAAARTLNLQGATHLSNIVGTFVAAYTAPALVTGILMNSAANAISHTNANNPDVLNANIPTTPANLDAAQGIAGFGGKAWSFGGSRIATVD